VRQHDQVLAGLADRLSEASYLLADVAGDIVARRLRLHRDPGRDGGP